jgi:hypothetical protein
VDEIIVLFRGRVVFKQYIPKKHKTLCDSKGYTYDIRVYSGKERIYATDT